jgi:hypothetical protein
MKNIMATLIQNGYSDTRESGWQAYLYFGDTGGEWPEYDRGWWDHYSEGY